MANDIYVDASGGSDATGDGTSAGTAYKHISKALEDVTFPLNESQKIVAVGDTTNQDDYDYQDSTDTHINLEGYEIQAGGSLVFEIDGWDDTKYDDGEESPLSDGGSSFDPTETKGCWFPPFKLDDGIKKVAFRGVAFKSDNADYRFGIMAEEGALGIFDYCTFEGFQEMGIYSTSTSMIRVNNCYFYECAAGVVAGDRSFVLMEGSNYVHDCMRYGLYAFNDSNISVRWWETDPLVHKTTKIYTTEARRNYVAIGAKGNSSIYIGRPSLDRTFTRPIMVQILNEVDFKADAYFGVSLEARSLLTGAKFINFTGKDASGNELNQGLETVPKGQQASISGNSTISK